MWFSILIHSTEGWLSEYWSNTIIVHMFLLFVFVKTTININMHKHTCNDALLHYKYFKAISNHRMMHSRYLTSNYWYQRIVAKQFKSLCFFLLQQNIYSSKNYLKKILAQKSTQIKQVRKVFFSHQHLTFFVVNCQQNKVPLYSTYMYLYITATFIRTHQRTNALMQTRWYTKEMIRGGNIVRCHTQASTYQCTNARYIEATFTIELIYKM